MTTDLILNQDGEKVRTSRAAIAVFVLSNLGALLFFLGVPAILALVAALIVRRRIGERLEIGGQNLATVSVIISTWSVVLFTGWMILWPPLVRARETSGATCGGNLRGIVMAMTLYAGDFGDFPSVAYAPYARRLNDPHGVAVADNSDDLVAEIRKPNFRDAGSLAANLWMLVLAEGISPKQFVCRSDPFAKGFSVASDGSNYFDNFQSGSNLSYSAAYAWRGDGTVGAWWKNTGDASLPIAADMAPMQGTGSPARNLTPAASPSDAASWNSANHAGAGQNVVFADLHVEFVRSPNVGQDNDNIYSMSASPSIGPAQFGGIPAGTAPPILMADKAPFDILMLPVRNVTTGGM